jgi:hypothetical protein
MNHTLTNEISPDELLTNFNGRSLKSIIIFTVVAHVILLLATSAPYIWRSVAGADSSKLSENERVDLAVKEASASMRRIAEQHGIKPQDLGSRFAAPAAPAASKVEPKAEPESTQAPAPAPAPAPEKPESTIEKDLKKAEPGPTVPGAGDEDLFK